MSRSLVLGPLSGPALGSPVCRLDDMRPSTNVRLLRIAALRGQRWYVRIRGWGIAEGLSERFLEDLETLCPGDAVALVDEKERNSVYPEMPGFRFLLAHFGHAGCSRDHRIEIATAHSRRRADPEQDVRIA